MLPESAGRRRGAVSGEAGEGPAGSPLTGEPLVEGAIDLLPQLLEPFRIQRAPLAILWPVEFPNGVKGPAHPGHLVAFRLVRVRLVGHLRVHPRRPLENAPRGNTQ